MSSDHLRSLVIPLPPLAEQRRIVAKVDKLMALCDELEEGQEKRRTVRVAANKASLHQLTTATTKDELSSAWRRVNDHFDVLYDTPETVADLRQAILQLAVQGKLVSQNPNDKPVAAILDDIKRDRADWLQSKLMKKLKALPPINDDDRNGIPGGWSMVRLQDLIDARFALSYGVLVPGPDTPGGIAFVRLQDLALQDPPRSPAKAIAPSVESKYARTRLVGGEILLGVVGSIGKLGIAPASWAGANIARAVCRIAAAKQIERGYLVIVMGCTRTQDYFIETTRTVAQPTLNIADVAQTLIPLPPASEQRRIVRKVDNLMAQCDDLEAKLKKAYADREKLLASAIHHLLNGAASRDE